METPASLLETLRARLREVQTRLVELNALRREEETLSALIRHYEAIEAGSAATADSVSMEPGDSDPTAFSLPRRMAVVVRKLLSTDIGPTASVPDIFQGLPKSLRGLYKAPSMRSNIETLRTQILTWKEEAGLLYDSGSVTYDPNALPAVFAPGELVLRTGRYRCAVHPSVVKEFRQERTFDHCPFGSSCSWDYIRSNGPSDA